MTHVSGVASIMCAKMNENPYMPWLNIALEEAVRRMKVEAGERTIDESTMVVRLVIEAEVN